MISDKTIEESTAKYWCAFADKDFKKALDVVLANIANEKNQKIAADNVNVTKTVAAQKKLNEGFVDFMSKFTPSDPAAGSTGIVGDLSGKSQEEIKANAAAMTAAAITTAAVLTPAGRAAGATVGTTVGKAAVKNPMITAAALLGINAAGDVNDSWFTKLKKLVNTVWDIGKFTAKHAKLIAVASTTAYALFKTANIWLPLLGSVVKSILRGNSLATVDFDSNGQWYRMRYDIKSKRWELMYKWFSLGSSPSPEEVEQLMNTKFFKAFIKQCKKYIEPIAGNSYRAAVIDAISQLTDKKTKAALESVFSDSATLNNMFAMKFKY